MFEVQKTTEKVKIYGEWYEVKQPTVKDAITMTKKSKEAPTEEALVEMAEYVSSLGIPKEVINEMETDHFIQLVQYLTQGSKKKMESISG